MKNLIILTISLTMMITSCYSGTPEVSGEKSEKTPAGIVYHNGHLNFSDNSEPGKINVFVMSTHWCIPCTALKNQLSRHNFNPEFVKLHYVYCEGDESWNTYKDSKTHNAYMALENLMEWPQVVIINPAGNMVKRFDATTLGGEADSLKMFKETVRVVSLMSENLSKLEKNGFTSPWWKDPYWQECRNGKPVLANGSPENEKVTEPKPDRRHRNNRRPRSTPDATDINDEAIPEKLTGPEEGTRLRFYEGEEKKQP